LTASFQKSPWQKTFELLEMPDLGDRRPSVLMDAMLALLPEDVQPNRLFLALFLRRLPADMRDHLAAQDLKTPEAMAAAANRLYDARPQCTPVSAISRREARPPSPGRNHGPTSICQGSAAGPRQAACRRSRVYSFRSSWHCTPVRFALVITTPHGP
jgi:hypothetical protein